MITFLAALFLVIGFIASIQLLKVVEKCYEVIRITKLSGKIIRSKELDDIQKEQKMQESAKKLFVLFFLISLYSAIAILMPLFVLYLLNSLSIVNLDEILLYITSIEFISITIVLTICYFSVKRYAKV